MSGEKSPVYKELGFSYKNIDILDSAEYFFILAMDSAQYSKDFMAPYLEFMHNQNRVDAAIEELKHRISDDTVAEARALVDERVDLPPGWRIEWGGQFENLAAATQRLLLLVPLALLLIFALLYSTFRSTWLALLIYLNVPLALTGGIAALLVRDYPFSISAGVGFIALFGIAVMNGVVLMSTVVQRRQEGLAPEQATREAATSRLRPVLMTALTDIIGFLPMAVATSAGAEVQRPLATVVIGGLVSSMLLTLFVLPAVYPWLARKR
jgi:cobalt-zinc-cadmium resistance protein CzcA